MTVKSEALPEAIGSMDRDTPFLGIGLALVAAFTFVLQDAGIKWLIADQGVLQILFLRSVAGLGIILIWLAATRQALTWRVKRPGLMMVRTVINIAAWCCFFYGLKYLPLATATALFFAFPIFLTALSVPLLGEHVGWRRWIAVVVGFGGVVVMTDPGGGIEWSMLLMLAAAVGWALTAIVTRKLSRTESTMTVLFYTLLGFVVAMAVPQVYIWQPIALSQFGLVAIVAFFGVIAQFTIIKAYGVAPPVLVAPFEYTGLVWAALLGYLVWGDVPATGKIVGAIIIVSSGIYIVHREARGQPRSK